MDNIAELMRLGMRRLASGVSIVSVGEKPNERQAMTASSVTSVSTDPASLLVCINQRANVHEQLTAEKPFAISLLAADQQELSNRCAGEAQGEARFDVGAWHQCPNTGCWFLADAQAVFICKHAQTVAFGTHSILIGKIIGVPTLSETVDPLIYADGRYLPSING